MLKPFLPHCILGKKYTHSSYLLVLEMPRRATAVGWRDQARPPICRPFTSSRSWVSVPAARGRLLKRVRAPTRDHTSLHADQVRLARQSTRLEVRRDVHHPKHNGIDADQPDHGERPGSRPQGDHDAKDDRGQPGEHKQPCVASPWQECHGANDLHDAGHYGPGRHQEEQGEGGNAQQTFDQHQCHPCSLLEKASAAATIPPTRA